MGCRAAIGVGSDERSLEDDLWTAYGSALQGDLIETSRDLLGVILTLTERHLHDDALRTSFRQD